MKDKAFCRSTNNINEDPRLAVNIVMADKAMHASQTLHSLHVLKKKGLRIIK